MPYRKSTRKAFSLRPISYEKHYVQAGPAVTAAAAITKLPIAISVALNAANAANEVPLGAHVKAVFIELWVGGDGLGGTLSQCDIMVAKNNIAEDTALTAAQSLLPNDLEWKNQIFLKSKGNLESRIDAGFIPFLRGWVKIPKTHQRFGKSDMLSLYITASTAAVSFCGQIVYKYTY